MKWHSWQGAHKGLALTPSLAVPQPPEACELKRP